MATSAPNRLTLDDLLEYNKAYASTTHQPLPSLGTMLKGDIPTNGPNIVIISCIDSRANPMHIFSTPSNPLTPRSAICLRNVGGRVSSFLTDIFALDTLFPIDQIVVIQHSDCGPTYISPAMIQSQIDRVGGQDIDQVADKTRKHVLVHGTDQTLKDDLALLRGTPGIRKELAEGAVGLFYDVKTGLMRRV